MTQTEQENAIFKIDGYFTPRPNESNADAFDRAQAECAMHLRREAERIESITLSQFPKADPFTEDYEDDGPTEESDDYYGDRHGAA